MKITVNENQVATAALFISSLASVASQARNLLTQCCNDKAIAKLAIKQAVCNAHLLPLNTPMVNNGKANGEAGKLYKTACQALDRLTAEPKEKPVNTVIETEEETTEEPEITFTKEETEEETMKRYAEAIIAYAKRLENGKAVKHFENGVKALAL